MAGTIEVARLRNTSMAAATQAATSGSTGAGADGLGRHHAYSQRFDSRPGGGIASRATGWSEITRSNWAASGTETVMGPMWSNDSDAYISPAVSTSPYVGLNPTMPQAAAGIRTEPPVSVPRAPCTTRPPPRPRSHQKTLRSRA